MILDDDLKMTHRDTGNSAHKMLYFKMSQTTSQLIRFHNYIIMHSRRPYSRFFNAMLN